MKYEGDITVRWYYSKEQWSMHHKDTTVCTNVILKLLENKQKS